MAVTYGFYNSLNGDRRYNAEQMSSIFDGIIRDGVFQVIGNTFRVGIIDGNIITVDTGKAWFNSTWIMNDSILRIPTTAADVLQKRIDAVVIEINKNESVRANSIKIITGTPNNSPRRPEMIRSRFVNQYPLAYIERKANSNTITQSDIAFVVGTSECPFINGILEIANIDGQLAQYQSKVGDSINNLEAECSDMIIKTRDTMANWVESVRNILNSSDVSSLGVQIDKANRLIKIMIPHTGWQETVLGKSRYYIYMANTPSISSSDNPLLVKIPMENKDAVRSGDVAGYLKAYDREFAKITAGNTDGGETTFLALKKPTMDLLVGLKGV